MADETKKCRAYINTGIGPIWFIGWLFTIGIAELTFWKGVLAILIWPYYLGVFLR